MKKLSFLSIITLLMVVQSHTLLRAQKPIVFEEVVKTDTTLTKEILFNRAMLWVNETFTDSKNAITINNPNDGVITGNGSFYYNPSKLYMGHAVVKGVVYFKFAIYTKEGRYKYVLSDFIHEGSFSGSSAPISFGIITDSEESPLPSRGGKIKAAWIDIKKITIENVENLIVSLKNSMASPTEVEKDW